MTMEEFLEGLSGIEYKSNIEIKQALFEKYPNSKNRNQDINAFINLIEKLKSSNIFFNKEEVVKELNYIVNIIKNKFNSSIIFKDKIIENEEILNLANQNIAKNDNNLIIEIAPFINPNLPKKDIPIETTRETRNGEKNLIKCLLSDIIDTNKLSIDKDVIMNLNTILNEIKEVFETKNEPPEKKRYFSQSDKIFLKRLIKEILIKKYSIRSRILEKYPNSKDSKKILGQFKRRLEKLRSVDVFSSHTQHEFKKLIWHLDKEIRNKQRTNDYDIEIELREYLLRNEIIKLKGNKFKISKSKLEECKQIINNYINIESI